MSEERPGGSENDGAAQLLASAHAHLRAIAADLALPADLRLSEWQRRTVAAMLAFLVRSVEDELRAALVGHFRTERDEALNAALTAAHVEIAVPILDRCGWVATPALLAALLRRAEEHRLHRAAAAEHSLLLDLGADPDPETARQAMALLVAQNARLDRFGEPVMARTELAAELEHELVWTICAALRSYAVQRHQVDPASADAAIAAAAASVIAAHDEGEGLDAACVRLARRLRDSGRLDGAMTGRSLSDGGLTLFVAILSVRAGLELAPAWEIFSDPSGQGAVLLLKAAALGREAAGSALLLLGRPEEMIAAQLDRYDTVGEEDAYRLLTLWRVDPGYRSAIARIAA